MQHLEQIVKETNRRIIGLLVDRLCLAIDVCRFHHLQIPAGEFIPEQFIDSHQSFRDAILLELVLQFSIHFLEFCSKPFYCQLVTSGLFDIRSLPTLYQSECIPNLIVEIATLFAERFVKENVVACRCTEHHTHAYTVCTILFYEHDGVGGVAETLAHLST